MYEGQEPGQLIVPHAPEPPAPTTQSVAPTPPVVAPAPTPTPVVETPTPAATPLTAVPQTPTVEIPAQATVSTPTVTPAANETAGNWQFTQGADFSASAAQASEPQVGELRWTASEFVAHDKSPAWYGALIVGGAVATALIYWLTKDKITSGIIIFALIIFGVFAARKPRDEQYTLSERGVQVGNKMYAFHDFKTFSVADEGTTASIVLMPLKRFMPALTVYITPEVEDRVVDFLSFYLPFSEHKADAVEGLLRRIRF